MEEEGQAQAGKEGDGEGAYACVSEVVVTREASSACGPSIERCYVYTRPGRVDVPADCRTFSNEALRRSVWTVKAAGGVMQEMDCVSRDRMVLGPKIGRGATRQPAR